MTKALESLVDLLDLERIEVDVFRGVSPDDHRQRVFGGQVAGQALVAAGRTVDDDRPVHSLHAYFLRPGDPAVPILYQVDRIRDGRSFTTRRVVAVQHGRPIFNLSASFHVDEEGPDHQSPMPDVADPDDVPTQAEQLAPRGDRAEGMPDRFNAFDIRYLTGHPLARTPGQDRSDRQEVWMRAEGALPDEPLLHACVVAYASDLTLLDTTLSPHGESSLAAPDLMFASLDHALWFHRPFRADEWLLYQQESPSGHGARAFARGSIFTRDGRLAASVAQEGLIRPLAR